MEQNPAGVHGEETIELEIKCGLETRVLAILRTIVTGLAEQSGFTPEQIGEIEIAVDEACANVVRHAYKHLGYSPDLPKKPDDEPAPEDLVLRLQIRMSPDKLQILIIDNGLGINKSKGGVSDVQEYLEKGAKGGLGTYIIKNFMDEVTYECPPDCGTVLSMTKYVQGPR